MASDFHFHFKPADSSEPAAPALSSAKRRRRILRGVAIAHAAVLLLPLGVLSVAEWIHRKPKPETIRITLTTPVTPRHGDPKLRPAPGGRTAPKSPVVKPKPAKPQPKQKPVKPQTKPRPAKVAEPVFEPSRFVKSWLKPKPRPKTAAQPRKPQPNPRPQQPEDPFAGLTPVHSTPENNPARPVDTPSARSGSPDAKTASEGDSGYASYDENLVATLYDLWKPPSGALLNGRKPEVYVRISVNPRGRVLKTEILKRSGFEPMDESVRKLLASLTDLPDPPKDHLVFEIVFIPLED